MSDNFAKKMMNQYEGNGWSRYQVMVLQQLDDHNKVLQNLNKELVEVKQLIAVSDTELKMWRAQVMNNLNALEQQSNKVLYDEDSLVTRINALERDTSVEKETSVRIKAMWAFYGAIVMFLVDVVVKLFSTFAK